MIEAKFHKILVRTYVRVNIAFMLIKCSNHNFSSSQLKSCGQQSSQSVANVRWSFLFPSVSNLGPTAI